MAPSWAQVRVMATPMPFAPPVTSTTLSLSCRSMRWRIDEVNIQVGRRPRSETWVFPLCGNDESSAAQIQETSVNRIVRAGDEGRFVRAEIKNEGGDLLGLSHSPNGLR